MCELQVYVRHYDPRLTERQKLGRYPYGGVVNVMQDGHDWGNKDGPPVFRIIKAPGVPVESLRMLTSPTPREDGFLKQRRMWVLDIDSMGDKTFTEQEVLSFATRRPKAAAADYAR